MDSTFDRQLQAKHEKAMGPDADAAIHRRLYAIPWSHPITVQFACDDRPHYGCRLCILRYGLKSGDHGRGQSQPGPHNGRGDRLMSTAQVSGNQFLSGLTLSDFSFLRNHLTSKDLRVGDVVHRCGDRIDEVVFPSSGVAVMRAPLREGPGTGIALIGSDGIIGGFAASASAPATCDCEVLSGGKASKMAASAFRWALDRSPTLRHWASQFDNALMGQVQQTVLCNATHSVEARMCRWLLEMRDRSEDDMIPLTQSTLADLLGVRRTTVTLVAGHLEAAGALDCRRGAMRIADRQLLERSCCQCFARLKSNTARSVPMHDQTLARVAPLALNSPR
jgi:CRP-like cAMP-binding protein